MESRSVRALGAAMAALVMSAAIASAQSLGELAAKEQERREKERQKRGGASKVITENDLRGAGRGTLSNAGATDTAASAPEASPSPGGPAAPAKTGEAPKEKSPEEIRAEQQDDWRKRTQGARDEEGRLAAALEDLQQKLNNVAAPLYGSGRTAVLAEFDKTKAALEAARQKVADLEEEGRRNSYR